MGPPVALRRWEADTIKAAMADRRATADPPRGSARSWPTGTPGPARTRRRAAPRRGWTQQATTGAGFGDVQPRYVFQVPLAGRTLDDVFAGFNQLWRRNIRKAEKAGVDGHRGRARRPRRLPRGLRRDGAPRPLHAARPAYFQRMWDALNAREPERLRSTCAHHDGHLAAATIMVRRRHARLVLLRRLHDRRPRRPPVQRPAVADDQRRARGSAARSTTCAASRTPSTRPTTCSASCSSRWAPAASPRSTPASGTTSCGPLWAKGFRAYQSRRG